MSQVFGSNDRRCNPSPIAAGVCRSKSPRLDRAASGGEDKNRKEHLLDPRLGRRPQLKDICKMNRSYRAESRRRRFAMMGRLITGITLTTIGIRSGSIIIGLGGFFIAIHAIFLCLDPDELMAIPEEFFPRRASNDSRITIRPSVLEASAKRPTVLPERKHSNSGVWDRDLDGGP